MSHQSTCYGSQYFGLFSQNVMVRYLKISHLNFRVINWKFTSNNLKFSVMNDIFPPMAEISFHSM